MNKDSKQTIFNMLSQIVLNGTNFVLIMLFTRFLPTDEYGIVSIYQAYVLFFAVLVGLNSQGSIGTAFVHIKKKEHNDYLASILLLSTINFVVILIFSMLIMPFFSRFSQLEPILIILMLFHSFGNFCFQFANIKYVYCRKAQYSCLMAVLVSVAMVVCSWIGIFMMPSDIPGYVGRICGISIPYIICGGFVLFVIYIKGNPFKKLVKYWKFCIPICIPLVFHGFSQVILAQTDKIMLQKILADNSVVGIYSFIVTFVHVLNSIYTALNNTWVPIYYEYMKNGQIDLIICRSERYHRLFLTLMIGFMMVSPEFVKLFADSDYWGGIPLIPIIVVSIYMVFLYSFAVNFELYHRKSKWIAIGTTAAAGFNIVFNALLIPQLEMYGAALATLSAYFLLFIFHEMRAKRIGDGKYPYKTRFFLWKIIIILACSVFFYIFIDISCVRWFVAFVDGLYLLYGIYKNKSIF